MSKNIKSRDDSEKLEGKETISSDLPTEKFQTTQQVAPSNDALESQAPKSNFVVERQPKKGSLLKQEVASQLVQGGSYTGESGMGISANGRSVSGTIGGILGASNSTPLAGKARSDSRVGKKFDKIATKLNFTPSEQVLVNYDEAKPLADAADQDQGFNGTYRNEFARSQKVAGATPSDLMYDRSVDLVLKDEVYFEAGQSLYQDGADDNLLEMPTVQVDKITGDYPTDPDTQNYDIKTGVFANRSMKVQLDRTGKVANIAFESHDLTLDALTPEDANKAAANRIIHQHAIELDRETMDSKAGDEKADIWTSLARAVKQPTRVNALIRDFESETGAYNYLAYKKASTAMAYQLNRALKDGQYEVTPGIEYILGSIKEANGKEYYDQNYHSMHDVFNSNDYANGSPALMIAAYDSPLKYNNKADLLLQPRGFRMHLQTADNNMNPLRLNSRLAQIINAKECFSTINREYDPMLPICMTDKAALLDRHNFNQIGGFFMNKYNMSFTSTNIESSYEGKSFILIPKELTRDGDTIYVYYKKSAGDGLLFTALNGEIKLDPDSSSGIKNITIFLSRTAGLEEGEDAEYLLLTTLSDEQDVNVFIRYPVNQTGVTSASFGLAFDAERMYMLNAGSYTYSYSDLRNRYVLEVKHPLIEGLVTYFEDSIGAKIYSLLSNGLMTVPMITSTQFQTLWQLLLCAATPYITKVRINSMRDVIYYEKNIGEYPYSELISIKEAPTKNYLNFGYEDYDHPLECKIMDQAAALTWVMPELLTTVSKTMTDETITSLTAILPWYFNENELNVNGEVDEDASCMSFPSVRSGIKYANLDALYAMSEKDIRLSLDRMTSYFVKMLNPSNIFAYKYGRTTDGQITTVLNSGVSINDILSAPRELGWSLSAPSGFLTPRPSYGFRAMDDGEGGLHSSFRIKFWLNEHAPEDPSILSASGVNINRAANFKQTWKQIFADESQTGDICGLVFGINDVEENGDTFSPFATLGTGAQIVDGPEMLSDQRVYWARIQKLPFCLSPFDNYNKGDASDIITDPFDLLYIFGLAGFRSSDYRESVYNREKEVINQGLLFINDPWVQISPLFREGSKVTGIAVSKGYEVK